MNIKYMGRDVHKETISIAVMNAEGKLVMESIIETKASTLLQLIQGLRGDLHVTLEEGTWAAWLYALLKPHVSKLVVCDPRKNALLKEGNKSDKIDARKLADRITPRNLSLRFERRCAGCRGGEAWQSQRARGRGTAPARSRRRYQSCAERHRRQCQRR